jgi:hypothetical protein
MIVNNMVVSRYLIVANMVEGALPGINVFRMTERQVAG